MSWTEERVGLLKKLWLEGQSATQIMRQLGGVTRNAVIGKVHRLGLTGENGPKPPIAPRSGARGLPPAPVGGAASPPRRYTHPSNAVADFSALPKAPKVASAPKPATVPAPEPKPVTVKPVIALVGTPVTMFELGRCCCQYPVGRDPGRGNMDRQLFCAEPRKPGGSPYCDTHHAVAYKRQPTAAEIAAAKKFTVDYADKQRADLKQAARR